MIAISVAVPVRIHKFNCSKIRGLFDAAMWPYPRSTGPFTQGIDELADCVVWTQWITETDLLFKRFDDVCS